MPWKVARPSVSRSKFEGDTHQVPRLRVARRRGTEGKTVRRIEYSYQMEVRTLNATRIFRNIYIYITYIYIRIFEDCMANSINLILGEDRKHN